jgi:hypothetical protein
MWLPVAADAICRLLVLSSDIDSLGFDTFVRLGYPHVDPLGGITGLARFLHLHRDMPLVLGREWAWWLMWPV